jgi:transcription termination factor Rho
VNDRRDDRNRGGSSGNSDRPRSGGSGNDDRNRGGGSGNGDRNRGRRRWNKNRQGGNGRDGRDGRRFHDRPRGENRGTGARLRGRDGRHRLDLIRDLERRFDRLTAIDPIEPFRFETVKDEMTTRIIDLFAPIGRGQRAMIVAPPKAGKTLLIQRLAIALHENHPEVRVICLLVDERPEEVTDFRRSVPAEVKASCSDQTVDDHVAAVEETFFEAREDVLAGKDVVVFIDSLTRLARAYNQYTESSGKTMTGGLDSAAMQRPRKFFGAARKIDHGGSLTVIASALIETGSRMDEIIFQEFKGTGNTEIVLSRKLAEQRIFPAIDINQSSTRREEKLMPTEKLIRARMLRRALNPLSTIEAMQLLLEKLKKTETNEEFLKSISVS